MTDYEKRIVDKIEILTFDLTSEMRDLLNQLSQGNFEDAKPIALRINYFSLEILRLHAKLTAQDE